MNNIRIAGVVVLYNPNPVVIENIKSYINEIEYLFAIDNSEYPNNEIVEELRKNVGEIKVKVAETARDVQWIREQQSQNE